jgi:hypothetical protein
MKDFWLDTTADAWFDASHQGKVHDFFRPKDSNFAYSMGEIARTGGRPTDKQYPWAEHLWNLYQQYLADEKKKREKK